jgi:hypothetical protein
VSTVPEVVVAAQLGRLPAKAKMFPDWLDAKDDPSLCTITKRAIAQDQLDIEHISPSAIQSAAEHNHEQQL